MKVMLQMAFVVVALSLFIPGCTMAAGHSPMLLFPGITGSQLWVEDSSADNCNTNGDSVGLWINLDRLIFHPKCIGPELRLKYDNKSDSYSNASNVGITTPGFGDVKTLEYLNPDKITLRKLPYFKEFVDFFVNNYSYVGGKDLAGAPYDWRLAPDELKKQGYFSRVKSLIEKMHDDSGNKVTLVAHSMGGPTSLYFLDTDNGIVTQQWKDQNIHAYVTLSGAWAGSPITVQEVISGNNLGKSYLSPQKYDPLFRNVSRTLESVVWLFPYPEVFTNILVTTKNRNYTAKDYMALFQDINYTTGYTMYKGIENIQKIPDPKVRTHCYWGLGPNNTPLRYYYNQSFPVDAGHDPNRTVNSSGDGAVNEIVSRQCLNWTSLVENRTFEGVMHVDMVKNINVLEAIAKVVTADSKPHSKVSGGMFHDIGYRTMYSAIRRMIKKMVQMMVRI